MKNKAKKLQEPEWLQFNKRAIDKWLFIYSFVHFCFQLLGLSVKEMDSVTWIQALNKTVWISIRA